MLVNVMVTWGNKHDDEKNKDRIQINSEFNQKYSINQKVSEINDFSFDDLQQIDVTLFLKMFQKSILQLGVKNALSILENQQGKIHADSAYIKNYQKDEVSASLEVIKF